MGRMWSRFLGRSAGLYSVAILPVLLVLVGMGQVSKPLDATPLGSLKKLRAHIADLREKQEASGKEDESLDYLDALEAYLAPRAYPYDVVDWDAYRRAIALRDANLPIIQPRVVQWEFLGPRNLQPPGQWAFGPGRISGRVASAAFDPSNPQVIYLASSSGGAWKTINGGTTWAPLGDAWSAMPTSCVAVDPSNPLTIYVGTGDFDGWGGTSKGIMRTTNGGLTWTTVGTAQFGSNAIRRLLIDPDNPQIITAVAGRGSAGNGKVWRSTDGGDTWNAAVNVGSVWCDVVCGAPDGIGNRTYYASSGGSTAQVWRSTNRGASWQQIASPMRTGVSGYDTSDLACSPTNPAVVYLLGTGDRKVWKSMNSGTSWTDVTGTLSGEDWGQAWYDFYITCSTNGSNDVLYVGLIDILQSTNGGSTWHSFMNGYTGGDLAHVDEHDAIVDPTNPSHLLTCADGGIYSVSVDGVGNGSFTSLNATLGLTEFYWGDFHPTDPNRMIGGAQDNGSPASTANNANWRSVTGGDGGAAVINQTNPNIQYTTYQYFGGSSNGGTIGFNRTGNNWASSGWVSVNVGSDRVAWMGPTKLAPSNQSVLYVATNYLWKYTDGSTWTPRLGNQALSSNSTVLSIGLSAADANVIYTGSGDGQLWVTRNGGSNWTRINTGSPSLPNRAYVSISPRDDNANDVLVGLSGTGAGHLYRCLDSSAGTRSWIDVSGVGATGLPNVPVNAIARDPYDPINTWYAGTDIGVFRTTNAGSTWDNITTPMGLPNVEISQLWIRNSYLCAVTYGRGMWRLLLTNGGGGGNLTVTGLSLNPDVVVGPNPSTGTVTISDTAPTGGTDVALSSDNAVATVPASVHVAEGQNSANFTVTTTVVASQTVATIKASLNDTDQTANLTVNPNGLTNLTLNPAVVVGGNSSTGTVSISAPAPAGGSSVHLTSSMTSVASVPGTVTIPQGQTQANFLITTLPTANDASPQITATLGANSVQATLTVNAPSVLTFTVNPTSIIGGNTAGGTITLNGRAPTGGIVVTVTSSDPSVATVPATVTVPANQTTVNFNVVTHPVTIDTGVTLTTTFHGVQRTVEITVTGQRISAFTVTPNPAVGGNSLTGRVTLAGPASGNLVVQLQSSNTALASMPSTVTIPSGQTSRTFTVTTHTVSSTSHVNLYAIYAASQQSVDLTLTSLQLASFTLSTNVTFEGSTVTGTVTLNGAALSGGAVVQLANSNPNAATVPTSVTVSQGQTSKSFNITAKRVSQPLSTSITASRNGLALPQTLVVNPISISSIQLALSSVTGGTNVNGVVRLDGPAPSGGYVVTLSSSYPLVARPPATLTIPQGQSSKTFVLTTFAVSQTTFVTISGAHGDSAVSTQLQVLPPEVATFHLSSTGTRGGSNITGTVTLTGKAPTGGMVVYVSANPNLAHPQVIPVMVNAGSKSKSFTINTQHVSANTPVVISARTLNVTRSATVTLRP